MTGPYFAGLRIITDLRLTETVEDWSQVRSPSRARRRRKLGHPQRIVYRQAAKKEAYRVGDALVMHPQIAKAMEKQIEEALLHGESTTRTTIDAGGALTIDHIERARRLLWP